jgi:hypothetical protein
MHRFEFFMDIWLLKVHKLITLMCVYPKLVPLGSLDLRWLVVLVVIVGSLATRVPWTYGRWALRVHNKTITL